MRAPFVAFFGSAGVGGRAEVHAWISHSSRNMRASLAAPPYQVDFAMPLAPKGSCELADEHVTAELEALGQVSP